MWVKSHPYTFKCEILCAINLTRYSQISNLCLFSFLGVMKTPLDMVFCSDKMSKKSIGEEIFYFVDAFAPKCDSKLRTLWKWNSFMSFLFTHAKTTNLDICAFGLKLIGNMPWFYLKSKRLVQGQISFNNRYVICFPPFLSIWFKMLCKL